MLFAAVIIVVVVAVLFFPSYLKFVRFHFDSIDSDFSAKKRRKKVVLVRVLHQHTGWPREHDSFHFYFYVI